MSGYVKATNSWHVPRRMTLVVAPSPVRRTRRPAPGGSVVVRDRNRTWGYNEIDETLLCTTLFRDEYGDSSLLVSTVTSFPCEVRTEAMISDLKLTHVRPCLAVRIYGCRIQLM